MPIRRDRRTLYSAWFVASSMDASDPSESARGNFSSVLMSRIDEAETTMSLEYSFNSALCGRLNGPRADNPAGLPHVEICFYSRNTPSYLGPPRRGTGIRCARRVMEAACGGGAIPLTSTTKNMLFIRILSKVFWFRELYVSVPILRVPSATSILSILFLLWSCTLLWERRPSWLRSRSCPGAYSSYLVARPVSTGGLVGASPRTRVVGWYRPGVAPAVLWVSQGQLRMGSYRNCY